MYKLSKPALLLLFFLGTCGLAPNSLSSQQEFTSSFSISVLDEHVGLPFEHLAVFDSDADKLIIYFINGSGGEVEDASRWLFRNGMVEVMFD